MRPLVISMKATAEATESTVLDVLGKAHERYGVSAPAFYVVRPDTVVAARGALADWPRMTEHLGTIFI
jgi:hypothetical protein